MRSGHFRNVRVGPRNDFHYEPRWIPPTWVRGNLDDAEQRLVVRRVPPPATWARPVPDGSGRQLGDEQPEPGGEPAQHPGANLAIPPHDLSLSARDHDDPFGVDLP
jgi:hypothetical protein